MQQQDEIATAIRDLRMRLDRLSSINEATILVPGGLEMRYQEIIEEAYAALGLVETQIDELRAELEYQHKRLDEIRDTVLAKDSKEEP
jgi:uncharacterized coiled-coil protein SlyX